MPEAPTKHGDTPSSDTQPAHIDELKGLRWFEICLVLVIAFGSYFLTSLSVLEHGTSALPHLQNERWIIGIFQELIGLGLLRYVLLRRGIGFRQLGLRWSFREVGAGLLVAAASYLIYTVGYSIVHAISHGIFPTSVSAVKFQDIFAHPSILAVLLFLLNPFFEELIVRAYLMTEIRELTGSWAAATVISVAVQTSYHLYYGWEGALSLAFQFLVFAVYYATTRRATPVIIAHGIFDIVGLLQLW
jgi:membrane protease YdiL (CAAX protease family)